MIDVSCAIIRNESMEVLVVQRGAACDHPYRWEFPGGKVDAGETAEDSVIREVAEELDLEIVVTGMLEPVEHDYGHKQIRLIPFICDTLDEKPVLHEHIAYRWINVANLAGVDFPEADVFVADAYRTIFPGSVSDEEPAGEAETQDTHETVTAVSDEELKSMIYRMTGSSEVGWIALSAASNSLLFRKLLDFTEEDDTRLVFRASWALTKTCELDPALMKPVLPVIVDKLLRTSNESAERSFLKILSLTGTSELDEKTQGRLVDHCFSLLRSRTSAIAVKVYSMDVLYEISKRFPGLVHELAAVMGMLPDDAPDGVKAKCRSVIRKLGSEPKQE